MTDELIPTISMMHDSTYDIEPGLVLQNTALPCCYIKIINAAGPDEIRVDRVCKQMKASADQCVMPVFNIRRYYKRPDGPVPVFHDELSDIPDWD